MIRQTRWTLGESRSCKAKHKDREDGHPFEMFVSVDTSKSKAKAMALIHLKRGSMDVHTRLHNQLCVAHHVYR